MPILAPSILAADFSRLGEQADDALRAGAEWLHIDVMDGHFVPNISIGPLVVRALRPLADRTETVLDVHLMIEHPEKYIERFVEVGADRITVHVETCEDLGETIRMIRSAGALPGVTLNPDTAEETLEPVLPLVSLVLVMSVHPGFGGQGYIPSSTARIGRIRRSLDRVNPEALVQVDGGITRANVRETVEAGASVIVAGSAVFRGEGTIEENVTAIRSAWAMPA